MSLDLQQLRTFVAISREGNIARAADALHMTASPVSRTLRELERLAGPLFERAYHDMPLTEQGRRLLDSAVAIVRGADDFLTLASGHTPAVRFAATPWIPASFAAALQAAAEASGPAEEAEPAMSSVLLHKMSHGEVDVALVHLPVDVPGIETAPIARYQFTLAVSDADPLAGRTSVSPTDLHDRRVLMLPTVLQPAAMAILYDWLTTCGVGTIEQVELADVPIISAKLRRKGVVTIATVGSDTGLSYARDIVTVPFDETTPDFQVGIAWRTGDALRRRQLAMIVAALRPADGRLVLIG